MTESFWDKFKQKTGEILGHPAVQQASELGNMVLDITAQLAENKNPLSIGSAVLASANVVAETLNIQFINPVTHYCQKNGLVRQVGELHRMLMLAGADTEFKITQVLKYDSYSFSRMQVGENSYIYWKQTSSSGDESIMYHDDSNPSKNYWLSKEFKHDAVTNFFWKKFPNGINLSYGKNSDARDELSISEIAKAAPYVDNENRAKKMVDYLAVSRRENVSRSFLLYGCPGSGKTAFVEKVASSFGSRMVKLDSSFLEEVNNHEIERVLSIMSPEIVLFDDFDRIDFDEYEGKFLYITENLKRKMPHITFFATVNNAEEVGPALLRPGRFDEKIKFTRTANVSCVNIVKLYCDERGVAFDEDDVARAIGRRNFTPAECKEAALRKLLGGHLLSFKTIFDDLYGTRNFGEEFEPEEDVPPEPPRKRGRPRTKHTS